jgi:hypothetical protein
MYCRAPPSVRARLPHPGCAPPYCAPVACRSSARSASFRSCMAPPPRLRAPGRSREAPHLSRSPPFARATPAPFHRAWTARVAPPSARTRRLPFACAAPPRARLPHLSRSPPLARATPAPFHRPRCAAFRSHAPPVASPSVRVWLPLARDSPAWVARHCAPLALPPPALTFPHPRAGPP